MPSNATTFVAQLLDEEWTGTVAGRANDVPKPTIIEGGDESKQSLRTSGKIVVRESGDVDVEQLGFNVTHKGTDTAVTIEIRAYDRRVSGAFDSGRDLLEGIRPDAQTPPDDYAGLLGEVIRIIDANRRGVAEFDRLQYSIDRAAGTVEGQGTHRTDVTVLCIRHAEEINPSP